MIEPALYLIPTQLSDVSLDQVLPNRNIEVVRQIKCFVVESLRSARRFLKRCDRTIDIDSLQMVELNEHTDVSTIEPMLAPLERGEAVGVISDAGCPAVADPGADLVAIAQRKGYRVCPLVGPSSILLSLMASGFNGQCFAFQGYLPVPPAQRAHRIKELEHLVTCQHQTQIFIEAPYRNNALLADLLRLLSPHIKLCVATDVTGAGERIVTRSITQWRKVQYNYNKVPTIFLIGG